MAGKLDDGLHTAGFKVSWLAEWTSFIKVLLPQSDDLCLVCPSAADRLPTEAPSGGGRSQLCCLSEVKDEAKLKLELDR